MLFRTQRCLPVMTSEVELILRNLQNKTTGLRFLYGLMTTDKYVHLTPKIKILNKLTVAQFVEKFQAFFLGNLNFFLLLYSQDKATCLAHTCFITNHCTTCFGYML
jgi:hypothetical protein